MHKTFGVTENKGKVRQRVRFIAEAVTWFVGRIGMIVRKDRHVSEGDWDACPLRGLCDER